MPFDQITTNSLALSSVTSDTILNNTIKFEDLSSDVSTTIRSTFATVSSLSASWGSGGSSTPVVTVADPLKFNFTGNGTTTNFTISGTNDSNNASYIEVFVANVRQEPTFSYTLSSNIVKFTEAPANGSSIFIITPNTKLYNTTTNQYSIPYFGGGSSAGIISKTYAELKALKDASQLVAGQWYKITDFQLKWWNQSINHTVVLTSPVVEPLNVFAIATNRFSPIAYSDLYPTDTIYYDFDATTSYNWGQINNNYTNINHYIAGIKGLIFRRIDNKWDIDMPYDFRHITINCCRPNLSSISEWSSSVNYKELDVVKSNNKLFFAISDNINVPLNNFYNWQPVSDYNEGLTYFPTDESWGFTVYKPTSAFDPSTLQTLINLPPLTASRVQKPTFTTTVEEVGIFTETSAYVKIGAGSHSNIFTQGVKFINLGGNSNYNIFKNTFGLKTGDTFERNILGHYILDNIFGQNCGKNIIHSMYENNVADTFWCNTLGAGVSDNTFEGKVLANIFGFGLLRNKLSTGFFSNFIRQQFSFNNIGNGFTGNRIGAGVSSVTTLGGFKDNIIKSMDSCIIGGSFNFNNIEIFSRVNIGAFCSNNKITGDFGASIIGNYFTNNTIGANCYWNNIGDNFRYNNIGSFFIGNNIGSYFTGNTIGNYFRKNTIGSNIIQDTSFSTASIVYNDYSKTIFLNSAGLPRLSYYNSSDVQIITSPTA